MRGASDISTFSLILVLKTNSPKDSRRVSSTIRFIFLRLYRVIMIPPKWRSGLSPSLVLRKLLSPLEYDYILLDCPPSLGLLTINALTASGEVFVPLTPEALPAKGLGTLLEIIDRTKEGLNPDLRLSGILITRYQRRKINRIVEESLRETFGDLVFKTKIRENVDISESPLQGTDIFSYSPRSIGAEDYRSLALEVDSKTGNK